MNNKEYNFIFSIKDLIDVLNDNDNSLSFVFSYLVKSLKKKGYVLSEEERLAMIKMLEEYKL